jgi:hypothetical protein
MNLIVSCLFFAQALANPPTPPASDTESSVSTNAFSAVASVLETGISFEDARKLRDPFKRPMTNAKALAKRSLLESAEISDFKVQGVVAGSRRVAILVGPGGKSFFVQAGQKIGPRGGVITKITPESIEITERRVDDLGDKLEEVTFLKVPQEGAQNQGQTQELIERVVRETGEPIQPSLEQR